jgi:hypothetical protein
MTLQRCQHCKEIINTKSPHRRACPTQKKAPAKKRKCSYCKKMFLARNIKKHRKSCRENPRNKRCKYCKGTYSGTFTDHKAGCADAPGRKRGGSDDLMNSGAVYGYKRGSWSGAYRDDASDNRLLTGQHIEFGAWSFCLAINEQTGGEDKQQAQRQQGQRQTLLHNSPSVARILPQPVTTVTTVTTSPCSFLFTLSLLLLSIYKK